MKTTLLILLLSFTKLPVHYCQVEINNCYTGVCDTIYIRVKGNLCLARQEGDTAYDLLCDGRNWVFRDSVCNFRVLRYEDKPFDH